MGSSQFYCTFISSAVAAPWIFYTSSMQHLQSITASASKFIHGDDFWHWHGLVLASAWLIGALIAILARKTSVYLHALLFWVIDATTAFFIVGGMLRVYPYIPVKWDEWPLIKKGHFIGGGVFLVLLLIQHSSGVFTLLKNIKYNPTHRKLAYYVSNFGRLLAVFGMVIAKAEQWILYSSIAISVVLLLGSTYKVFFEAKPSKAPKESAASVSASASPNSRSKSPKRD